MHFKHKEKKEWQHNAIKLFFMQNHKTLHTLQTFFLVEF